MSFAACSRLTEEVCLAGVAGRAVLNCGLVILRGGAYDDSVPPCATQCTGGPGRSLRTACGVPRLRPRALASVTGAAPDPHHGQGWASPVRLLGSALALTWINAAGTSPTCHTLLEHCVPGIPRCYSRGLTLRAPATAARHHPQAHSRSDSSSPQGWCLL